MIGKASLYDGGMTDDEDGYLDSRCSPRSAGVSFGLAEFGRGPVLVRGSDGALGSLRSITGANNSVSLDMSSVSTNR